MVLRLGIAQYEAAGTRGESLERLRRLLAGRRVEADVVLLPEYSDVHPSALARGMRDTHRVFVDGLVRLAAEYGSLFIAGVAEEDEGCRYSSVVATWPSGRVEVVYRKRILFDALGYRESKLLCRGRGAPRLVELGGFRVGFVVCFELRFPELARQAVLSGATLIAVPAAWYHGLGKEEQLRFLAQARASENTAYLAVADQVGGGFSGRSMVVDPYGFVELDLGTRPGYGEAELEESLVAEARERLPLLSIAARLGGQDSGRS